MEFGTDILFVSGLEFSLYELEGVPLGQQILKSILSSRYDVEAVNFNVLCRQGAFSVPDDPEQLVGAAVDVIIDAAPRVVGFYTICNTFHHTVAISQRLRERAPDIFIFYGGPHATVTAQACLETLDCVDLVCLGESERSIMPMAGAMLGDRNFEDVPGVAFRKNVPGEAGFTVVQTERCPLISADELANYSLVKFNIKPEEHNGYVYLEGGRGCPYRCSFCSTSRFWARSHRVKPVGALIAEMDECRKRYGAKGFTILHDHFTANRTHIREFCNQLIAKGSPYRWSCSSRTDSLDANQVALMHAAGCTGIFLGIETGSPRMQKITHKGLDLSRALDVVRSISESGIKPTASFIYGFPQETENDLRQTLQMMADLKSIDGVSVQLHRLYAEVGTEMADEVIEEARFDPEGVEYTVFNPHICGPSVLRLIEEHKDLFLHLYTFPSDTREKYKHVSIMVMSLTKMERAFPATVGLIYQQVDLLRLYLDFAPRWEVVSRNAQSANGKAQRNASSSTILEDIVAAYPEGDLPEVFRIEQRADRFFTNGSAPEEVIEADIDVLPLVALHVVKHRHSVCRLYRDPDTHKPMIERCEAANAVSRVF